MPKAGSTRSKNPKGSSELGAAVAGGPGERFDNLPLPGEVIEELAYQGLTHAFPIQQVTLPDALAGRDVLGRAETGSGKTLAFALSTVSRLRGRGSHRQRPLAVVLVPTRELAMQVIDVINPLARAVKIRTLLVAGGMNMDKQIAVLRGGVEIIVATPGRLLDLLGREALFLDRVEVTVLDEADHMADLGFIGDLRTLLDLTPTDSQRMLFSATLDGEVGGIAKAYLRDPITHSTAPITASIATMKHVALHLHPKQKAEITARIASRAGTTIAFCRTQLGADRVAEELRDVGIRASALHGAKQQGMRTNILAGFKEGAIDVLVATDVAARGIHVDNVGMVLHVDPPDDGRVYLHRSGRTARAGGTGVVATLVLPHQKQPMEKIAAAAGVDLQVIAPAFPDDADVASVLGARKPTGEPIDDPALVRHKGAPRKLDPERRKGKRYREAPEVFDEASGRMEKAPPRERKAPARSRGGRPSGPNTRRR